MQEHESQGLESNEHVARFIYDSDKVTANGRVQSSAFLPKFEGAFVRWETSVCRLAGCDEARVWQLATNARPDRSVKALAKLSIQAVISAKLECVDAPVDGFPEHAVLLGWPDDKPAQKEIAVALSKASVAVRAPGNTGERDPQP